MFTQMRFNLRFVSTIIFVVTFLVGGLMVGGRVVNADVVQTTITPTITLSANPTSKVILKSTLVQETGGIPISNSAVETAISGLTPIKVTLTNTGDTTSNNVRIAPIGAGSNIQLWAKDTSNNWYDINITGWMDPAGNLISAGYNATTDVYVISDLANSYPVTVNLIQISDSSIVATTGGTIIVNDPVPVTPAWNSTVELTSGTATGSESALTADLTLQSSGAAIQFADTKVNPFNVAPKDAEIPFKLTSTPSGVNMTAYYTALKGLDLTNTTWGQYLISTLPGANSQTAMFYIKYDGANYTISDGTQNFAGNPTSPMLIPGNFPAGIYVLAGEVNGTPVTVTLNITNTNGWIAPTSDTTLPTVVSVSHIPSTKTITYTFSEPMKLVSQADGTDTVFDKGLLGIYSINPSTGNYTNTPVVQIETATLDSNILTVTYTGDIPAGTYIIDAWGYDITDLAKNKIAKSLELIPSQTFTVASQSGGDSIPEDTTKPDLVSVAATITNKGVNAASNYNKGVPIVTYVGEKVGPLSAIITENSTLVSGTEGIITITGPLMGDGTEATAPYGTFTVNGTNVTITPYPGNDVLADVGIFTFKVAAGSIKDTAGNTNDEISFTLIVFDITPPIITVTGTNPLTIAQGSVYEDAGATATDNVDNNVIVTSSGTVDSNTIGTYIITYNAKDKATNQATPVTRTVNVTDQTPPTGNKLTIVTKLFPDGISVSPVNDKYSLPSLSLDGTDVFQSLSIVVIDDNNIDTSDVPVYIDGNTKYNGYMKYDSVNNIWNYTGQTSRPDFSAGPHSLVATFKDLAGNTTTLTANFTTDNTAPTAGDLTMTTNLQGTITVSPSKNIYTITKPLAFNGLDVMTRLSVQITDNDLNTNNVPVTINNILDGQMVYDSNDKIWNYTRPEGTPPFFTDGIQTITAIFKDNAGNTTPLALKFTTDTTAPVGGALTMKTNLFPDGVKAALENNVYTITPALSLDGSDVFNSLSVVVTDDNIDTSDVPVYIDGNTTANGYMQYDSVNNVWNYTGQTSRPDFSTGTHSLVATFKDLAGNMTTLTANFTTDNTAPIIKLIGNPSIDIIYGSTYTDAGATASDDTNGDITTNILTVNPVNTYNLGQYIVTYNVSDNAKNKAQEITRTVNVIKAPSATTITCPTSVTYTGSEQTPCTATVTGTGGLSETFTPTYTDNINAGTANVSYTYAGDVNHEGSIGSTSFIINKATQTITWVNPADITYGTALSSTQLNANGNGTATYNPATGVILGTGDTQVLSVTFTGDDNYNPATKTVDINVLKATPTIIVTPYSVNYDGNSHTAIGTATGVNKEDLSSGLVLTGTTNINVGDYSTDTWTFTDKNGNYKEANGIIHDIISISPSSPSTIIETTPNTDDTTTKSGTIPTETSFRMDTPIGNVVVVIPAGITITGPAGWNGTISAPTITDITLPTVTGETRTLTSAIELGFSGSKLTFDKAVKITMPGQAGKRVGYTRGTEPFTEITNVCGANDQAWADTNLSAGSECKIDAGTDLVIWTKHFTTFATYTQTVNPILSSGGGSYTPVVVNNIKDEGCLSDNLFSITTGKACPKNNSISTTTGNTLNGGQVLGAEKYNFTKLLKKGSKGNEVMELQKFLIAAGYDIGKADGNFGNKTKLAVVKYQIANKLKGDGSVGALTRALLNK